MSCARRIADTESHPATATGPDNPGRRRLSKSEPQIRSGLADNPPRQAILHVGVGPVSLREAFHHRLVGRWSYRYGLLGEAQEKLSSATLALLCAMLRSQTP